MAFKPDSRPMPSGARWMTDYHDDALALLTAYHDPIAAVRRLDHLYLAADNAEAEEAEKAWARYDRFRAQVAPLFTDERSEA